MWGLPDGSVVRNSSASAGDAGDTGLIPGSGGNGNPLQYSCLENLMGRAAWHAAVHGVAKESVTTELLNSNIHIHIGYWTACAQWSKIRKQPISFFSPLSLGFQVVQVVKSCLQCRRPGLDPWVGTIPWRRAWQPTPVFLPGESHRQKSLVGYSPSGHKKTYTTEWLSTAQSFSCENISPSHVVVSTTI